MSFYLQADNGSANPNVGSFISVLSGFSNNDSHRFLGASGGIITQILTYLFESGNIDAAVVAVRRDNGPLGSELRIISTVNEVFDFHYSVYSPTSYADIVTEIRSSQYSRFAIVGLPCHIEELTSFCEQDQLLKDKIRFSFSLVCGNLSSNKASESSLDLIGHNADISICDAWVPKCSCDTRGRNLMVVRSSLLLDLLMKMASLKLISLYDADIDDFINANQNLFKKNGKLSAIENLIYTIKKYIWKESL